MENKKVKVALQRSHGFNTAAVEMEIDLLPNDTAKSANEKIDKAIGYVTSKVEAQTPKLQAWFVESQAQTKLNQTNKSFGGNNNNYTRSKSPNYSNLNNPASEKAINYALNLFSKANLTIPQEEINKMQGPGGAQVASKWIEKGLTLNQANRVNQSFQGGQYDQ